MAVCSERRSLDNKPHWYQLRAHSDSTDFASRSPPPGGASLAPKSPSHKRDTKEKSPKNRRQTKRDPSPGVSLIYFGLACITLHLSANSLFIAERLTLLLPFSAQSNLALQSFRKYSHLAVKVILGQFQIVYIYCIYRKSVAHIRSPRYSPSPEVDRNTDVTLGFVFNVSPCSNGPHDWVTQVQKSCLLLLYIISEAIFIKHNG